MTNQIHKIAFIVAASTFTAAVSAQIITDIDGDGIISLEEVQAARDARKAEVLAQFDLDGDGELSADERDDAREARRAEKVEVFDTNGDGELSRDERQAARESRRESFSASFDLDNSGGLSDTEQANLDSVRSEIRGDRGGKHGAKRGGGKRRNH